MATTTPNYGWSVPTSTDLVKDGATAIETLGDSVDATVKALNPETTLGDIAYRSATANTNTRLAIGTSGQILSVNGSGVPEWTTAAASGSQTSIASGSLTGSSVTLSSIVGTYRDLKLVITNFRPSSDLKLMMRWNGATTGYKATPGTYTASTNFADSELFISTTSDGGNTSQALIVVDIPEYANTVAFKTMTYTSLVNNETTNANGAWEQNAGLYISTSAITSITLLPQAGGTFTTGSYVLYGVK
jgi:hypothetical protein